MDQTEPNNRGESGRCFLPSAVALFLLMLAYTSLAGGAQTSTKQSPLLWAPPDVDVAIPSISNTPPCVPSEVLAYAGQRSTELVDELQNFTARETIRYLEMDAFGIPLDGATSLFNYAVDFTPRSTSLVVAEARQPIGGPSFLPEDAKDAGLPALALIFHPFYQGDYDFHCEGGDSWKNDPAWVIHFTQRKGRPSRTHAFRSPTATYPAALKGRAWISKDSYQVLHLETALIKGIGMLNLKSYAVSVNYAQVHFRSRDVAVWLPQDSVTYSDFVARRDVVEHTFKDFLLTSVQSQTGPMKPN
jgi:hypothetical protein